MNKFFYNFLKFLAHPVVGICLMPKIYNKQYLKISSRCIVIANHTTYWDPVLVGTVVSAPIHFMAKRELIKGGLAQKFLMAAGIIPVSRGKNDLKAIKTSMKLLKNEEVLGIFPEGTRSKNGELLPFESGVSVLAIKTNTPILPIYIHRNGIHPGHRVKVNVGKPVNLNSEYKELVSNGDIEQATEHLRNILLFLKKQITDE